MPCTPRATGVSALLLDTIAGRRAGLARSPCMLSRATDTAVHAVSGMTAQPCGPAGEVGHSGAARRGRQVDAFASDSVRMIKEVRLATGRQDVQILLFSATFNDRVKSFALKVVPDANQARPPRRPGAQPAPPLSPALACQEVPARALACARERGLREMRKT